MNAPITPATISTELIEFARDLVRIPSYSGQEEAAARFVAARMEALGYDVVKIDRFGSVLGRIGQGGPTILFDGHLDTVQVHDAEAWAHPPFSGDIADGCLWGRGAVDMKSGLAAAIYAAALARDAGKTIYVSATVAEESCDGESLKHLLAGEGVRPDYAIICEPSANTLTTGHKGKAQIILRTEGISAHGSAPEKGLNAVYEMAEIIQRVEQRNRELAQGGGRHGTLVLAQISSTAVSLNAVPSACEIYLDRRLVSGESEAGLRAEMDRLIAGKRATWQVDSLRQTTWTGETLGYTPLHPAWEIARDHPLTRAFCAAYARVYGQAPQNFDYWDFSTNAVAVVAAGIPTLGFGPGEYKLAHMRDEKCPLQQIVEACAVYAQGIEIL